MINLPKPSPLSMGGSNKERIDYILRYLQRLVSDLERVISKIGSKEECGNSNAICEISFKSNGILITRLDGSQQFIENENQ